MNLNICPVKEILQSVLREREREPEPYVYATLKKLIEFCALVQIPCIMIIII